MHDIDAMRIEILRENEEVTFHAENDEEEFDTRKG